MKLYTKDCETVVSLLKTDIKKGLTTEDVLTRQKEHGLNVLPESDHRSIVAIFIEQFKSPLIYLLLVAAVIIFMFGDDRLDAFIISGVLLFNSILGTIQERRTHSIIESLRQLISTDTIVVRDGKRRIVNDADLVVGDVIILQEGQRVPADARIVECRGLLVDEAVLTGESNAVRKNDEQLDGEHTISDRINMVFRGTYILSGSGKAVVTGIGLKTEIGLIHKSIDEINTDIPLRKELDRLSYTILLFILLICGGLFVIGLLGGKPMSEMLVMLTALFICVVPEGLPVALTLVLVAGANRMAGYHVLVKNLQAVESLGRADVIIVDKTGTLTRNEMMVSKLYADGSFWKVDGAGYHEKGSVLLEQKSGGAEAAQELIVKKDLITAAIAASLLNNTEIEYDAKQDLFLVKGDPTEAALYVFSQKMAQKRELLDQEYTLLYEIPFDQLYRYHAGFYAVKKENEVEYRVFVIGAPEALIARSQTVTQDQKEGLAELLQEGLRVVAIGTKGIKKEDLPIFQVSQDGEKEAYDALLLHDVQLLGFFGIQDAVRTEVAGIVTQARQAGLFIVMATGDHQKTAIQVAKTVGIYDSVTDQAVDGSQLDAMSDQQLLDNLFKITVYSRCSPQHKMRIVKLFHEKKHIVAMTGDGINDVPSLMAADLGIAMGRIGTEVAKQAADLVLLDDSFANIIHAIKQGRHIFYSLKRVILYFFATNMGEILIVLFALVWGILYQKNFPLPLTAAQILWLNLVTDAFLDVSLSMEPQEPGLLDKKWLETKQQLIDKELLVKTFVMATPMAICSLITFFMYYQHDLAKARTMTLIMMAMFQWFNGWNCRSTRYSIFKIGLFSNRWFLMAASFVLSLQLLVVYVPAMQYVFKTVPLTFFEWGSIALISSSIFFVEEARKLFLSRKGV